MLGGNSMIPYDWLGTDYTRKRFDEDAGKVIYDKRRYTIFIWGHNRDNHPVCWVINDYMPHCFVRIEQEVDGNQNDIAGVFMKALHADLTKWVQDNSTKAGKSYLKSLLASNQPGIIAGYTLEERYPLFYYNDKKSFLYKVFFYLNVGMQSCYTFLDKNPVKIQIRTNDGFRVVPVYAKAFNNGDSDRISTEQKFIVEKGLNRCDWISGNGELSDPDERYTSLYYEYHISCSTVSRIDPIVSKTIGYPKPDTISFDAETWSEVYNRFPKANRLRDCMYAMGFRHRKYMSFQDSNPMITTYLFVIWDPNKHGKIKYPDVEEYGNIVIVYCLSEKQFYERLFEYVVKLDPTWIVSFNGLGFDWPYLQDRCALLGVKVPNLSRLLNWDKSQFLTRKFKQWSSIFPNYPGRMDIDMLPIIRGQFKMNSYSLKNVTRELLPKHKGKVELPYKEQFRIFGQKDLEGIGKTMDYLAMDVKLPEALYDRMTIPVYLHTNGGVMNVNPLDLFTQGQSIRCVNQLYERCEARGMFVDTRHSVKPGKYIGGLVWKNIQGRHQNVLIVDFNSLYPSKITEDNICFSTFVDEAKEKLKPEGSRFTDADLNVVEGEVPIIDKKTKEMTHKEYHKFRFVKKHIRLGLIPEIVRTLNALRTEYKKEMAACKKKAAECEAAGDLEGKDKWLEEAAIWDVKQLSVKTSANSMYGFMGMKTGKYSFVEGAMATTLSGQKALRTLIQIIIDLYNGFIVYGDTDSAMVIFPEKYVTQHNYATNGPMLAKEISDHFGDDLNLACENFMLVFVSFTPKRYAGIKINPKNPSVFPTEEEILDKGLLYIKGLICVRGNTCKIISENYKRILLKVLIGWNFRQVSDFIAYIVLCIMRRDFPLSDYTFVQKLGHDYKSENHEMAKFSDRLKQMGRSPAPGDELSFVFMRTLGDTYKGNIMQPPDAFVENGNVLDTVHYIENCFSNPVSEILTVNFKDTDLTEREKKIIRPRKPTKAQTVTPVWHMEEYIMRYILPVHKNWLNTMMSIRYIRDQAIAAGLNLNYIHDEENVRARMLSQYKIVWNPPVRTFDEDIAIDEINKTPIHRHAIWNEPEIALTNPNKYGHPVVIN